MFLGKKSPPILNNKFRFLRQREIAPTFNIVLRLKTDFGVIENDFKKASILYHWHLKEFHKFWEEAESTLKKTDGLTNDETSKVIEDLLNAFLEKKNPCLHGGIASFQLLDRILSCRQWFEKQPLDRKNSILLKVIETTNPALVEVVLPYLSAAEIEEIMLKPASSIRFLLGIIKFNNIILFNKMFEVIGLEKIKELIEGSTLKGLLKLASANCFEKEILEKFCDIFENKEALHVTIVSSSANEYIPDTYSPLRTAISRDNVQAVRVFRQFIKKDFWQTEEAKKTLAFAFSHGCCMEILTILCDHFDVDTCKEILLNPPAEQTPLVTLLVRGNGDRFKEICNFLDQRDIRILYAWLKLFPDEGWVYILTEMLKAQANPQIFFYVVRMIMMCFVDTSVGTTFPLSQVFNQNFVNNDSGELELLSPFFRHLVRILEETPWYRLQKIFRFDMMHCIARYGNTDLFQKASEWQNYKLNDADDITHAFSSDNPDLIKKILELLNEDQNNRKSLLEVGFFKDIFSKLPDIYLSGKNISFTLNAFNIFCYFFDAEIIRTVFSNKLLNFFIKIQRVDSIERILSAATDQDILQFFPSRVSKIVLGRYYELSDIQDQCGLTLDDAKFNIQELDRDQEKIDKLKLGQIVNSQGPHGEEILNLFIKRLDQIKDKKIREEIRNACQMPMPSKETNDCCLALLKTFLDRYPNPEVEFSDQENVSAQPEALVSREPREKESEFDTESIDRSKITYQTGNFKLG